MVILGEGTMHGRTYSRSPWRLGEIMIQKRMISWEDLAVTLEVQSTRKELLGQLLVQRKLITDEQLTKALAAQCGLDFVYLAHCSIQPEALFSVPKSFVIQFQFMPLKLAKDYLLIAVANPFNLFLNALLSETCGKQEIRMVVASPRDIKTAIKDYYNPSSYEAA